MLIFKEANKSMYINGRWVENALNEWMEIYNPANMEILCRVPRGNKEDIDQAVQAAKESFESQRWREFTPDERGRLLNQIAQRIRQESDLLAKLETFTCGKPISQSKSDVEAAARYMEYYAGVADKILGETIPIGPGILDYTMREPIGITAHIIPWNYPLQVMSRSIAAAIATGNAVIVKPAEDTPLTALKLAEFFDESNLPKGIFNVVTGYGSEAGAALSSHPDVNHITFTGSVETGSNVMAAASRNITPVTLELGGKSPNIVFEDCNQEESVNWVVKSITQNSGQTCSAGSRLLVQSAIFDEFVEKVAKRFGSLTIGPGISNPDIGPIISSKQLNRIEHFMDIAKEENAIFLTGGKRKIVEGYENGLYFPPTLLTNVNPKSRLAQEEIFGPVLIAIKFDTEEEAIRLANLSDYGLVAGIWTSQIGRAHRIAQKVKAGQIFINNYGAGGGIQMPFGGYKKSGIGREKGLEALRNYTQLKNVAVNINL